MTGILPTFQALEAQKSCDQTSEARGLRPLVTEGGGVNLFIPRPTMVYFGST
jgi:hypothetical protein